MASLHCISSTQPHTEFSGGDRTWALDWDHRQAVSLGYFIIRRQVSSIKTLGTQVIFHALLNRI